MDVRSFRAALIEATPNVGVLLNAGLGRDEAMGILSSFALHERRVAEVHALPDAALGDLFSLCDASRVEIGMVRFRNRPEVAPKGWIIGQVEADGLMLETASGEIVVKELGAPDHTLWRCAKDGSSLLGALADAAAYLGACIAVEPAGPVAHLAALKRCIALAGGDAYAPFYRMLLAVE